MHASKSLGFRVGGPADYLYLDITLVKTGQKAYPLYRNSDARGARAHAYRSTTWVPRNYLDDVCLEITGI